MFGLKKHKCERCGKIYRGTAYQSYDEQEKEIILCEGCFNQREKEIKEEPQKQEKEFKKKIKNLIKQILEDNMLIRDIDKKISHISFIIESYSKERLNKENIKNLKEMAKKSLASNSINKPFEKGLFLSGVYRILPTINATGKSDEEVEKMLEKNEKPTKIIYFKIIIKSVN